MLYLVGENIDKSRAHYQAESGKITQLMRGIYVDAGVDADEAVLAHAIRVARYLYPRAYLSGASAVLGAPTRDGKLYLSGLRAQRTRIRSLEIAQNKAPENPSIVKLTIQDSMGEFSVSASSIAQRFLEAFRMRSEHAASLTAEMKADLAQRLTGEHGSPEKAADALWGLARKNDWGREGGEAERYLLKSSKRIEIKNEAELSFSVAWHGKIIGNLSHDGFEWNWAAHPDFDLPLVQQRIPGTLPPFVLSLLPEGWLERVLKENDPRGMLKSGKRYMSNITIVTKDSDLKALPQDVLANSLTSQTSADGAFLGVYDGPGKEDIEASFEENLAKLYGSDGVPRLSGVQIKAPMFLNEDSWLEPADGKPFTHILKPAGTGGFEALPVIEFMAMSLGKSCGFDTPPIALAAMPQGMPPALIVERFDIRTSIDDHRQFAMEDMCSVLDLPPASKYEGSIERMARAVRSISTVPDEDMLLIFKRAMFAWLISDGDMHLKNLALLKMARPGASRFESVRLAPLYDAVTTIVFPGLENDLMALTLNGKKNRINRRDFIQAATTMGLSAGQANEAIDEMLAKFTKAVNEVSVPSLPNVDQGIVDRVERMIDACEKRFLELSGVA